MHCCNDVTTDLLAQTQYIVAQGILRIYKEVLKKIALIQSSLKIQFFSKQNNDRQILLILPSPALMCDLMNYMPLFIANLMQPLQKWFVFSLSYFRCSQGAYVCSIFASSEVKWSISSVLQDASMFWKFCIGLPGHLVVQRLGFCQFVHFVGVPHLTPRSSDSPSSLAAPVGTYCC